MGSCIHSAQGESIRTARDGCAFSSFSFRGSRTPIRSKQQGGRRGPWPPFFFLSFSPYRERDWEGVRRRRVALFSFLPPPPARIGQIGAKVASIEIPARQLDSLPPFFFSPLWQMARRGACDKLVRRRTLPLLPPPILPRKAGRAPSPWERGTRSPPSFFFFPQKKEVKIRKISRRRSHRKYLLLFLLSPVAEADGANSHGSASRIVFFLFLFPSSGGGGR